GTVPVALGSDSGGSVRQPAAFCGVVGYKPSYGLLSRYGLVAFASSLDQIGLFTRSVSCLFPLMGCMTGLDPRDSTSIEGPRNWSTQKVDPGSLRIGVLPTRFLEGVQTEILQAYNATLSWYVSQGAKVVEVPMADFDRGLSVYYIVAVAEASANLARFDGVRYGLRHAAPTLEAMYDESRSRGFGSEVIRRILLGTHVLSAGYHDAYYTTARRVQKLIQDQHNASFDICDVLLTPTTASTAFELGSKTKDPISMYRSDQFTVCANLAGIPALSVPCGVDDRGLPMGLQFVGRQGDDVRLLSIAAAWEAAHPFTSRPRDV
ncbi:MAG: amidase family protein, partial [Planctomycetota bacterium]